MKTKYTKIMLLFFLTSNCKLLFPQLQVVTSGDIGIGTTAPGEKLEVKNADATVRVWNTNDPGGAFLGNTYYALQLGLFNPSASAFGVIAAGTKRSFFGFDITGQVGSLTNNYGSPSFRNILDDGSGKAGIMTTSPQQTLHVNGNTKTQSLEMGGSTNYIGFNLYYDSVWKYRSTDYGYLIRHSGSDFGIWTAASGTAGSAATVTQQICVKSGGNVGIGTTAPSVPLEISGNNSAEVVKITSTWSTGGQSNLTFNGGTGGFGQAINNYGDFYITNNSSNGYLYFRTNGGNNRMIINSSGRVGIGMYPDATIMLNVNGTVANNGTILTSDQKFKTHIATISDAISIISKLKPSTYFFDTTNVYGMKFSNQKQYGLISQDVEQILPQLVSNISKSASVDSSGKALTQAVTYKGLNYIAFIPILIKGIQEQQQKIDSLTAVITLQNDLSKEQEVKINNLQSQVTACCNKPQGMKIKDTSITNPNSIGNNLTDTYMNALPGSAAMLFQNIPNPFNQQTSIQYFIPTTAKSASIMVFDLQGKLIKTIGVSNYGNGEVTINGNELNPGMFVYSLIVDSNIVDTKRMILTQ